jgi:hypothetical protein
MRTRIRISFLPHDMRTIAGVGQVRSQTSACRLLVRSTGKLSVKRDTVKAAEAVGKSGAAMDALGTGQLSLEEAAAVSGFIVIWTHVRVPCRTTVVN